MKIVIDIPKETYELVKSWNYPTDTARKMLFEMVKNGTSLPKGHWTPDKSRPALQDCSICGALSIAKTNYCSNCGGDMRGDENG